MACRSPGCQSVLYEAPHQRARSSLGDECPGRESDRRRNSPLSLASVMLAGDNRHECEWSKPRGLLPCSGFSVGVYLRSRGPPASTDVHQGVDKPRGGE